MKKITISICFLVSIFFVSCSYVTKEKTTANVTIFYTNDEHGWMSPNEESGGAPGLKYRWEHDEHFNGNDSFLILGGGDMWSGPAVSTWFKGEPMVDVMNEMGYDATTIGNHEFDFTVDVLNKHSKKLTFPLIAANIEDKQTKQIPSFAIPYLIKICNGLKIGIIGLATTSTPLTTFPKNVENYNFLPYSETIDKYAPILIKEKCDVIIVLGHLIEEEADKLVSTAKKYGISIITGGHSHQTFTKVTDGILLFQSGSNFKNYVKVELQYNFKLKKSKILSYKIIKNTPNAVDSSLLKIVKNWEIRADSSLSEVIGYCSEPIKVSSNEMENMLCDSWFYTFPEANASISNSGGIRQDIPKGNITLGTILGLLPFNNTIYKLKLSGYQLIDCVDNYCIGGFTTIGGYKFLNGKLINRTKNYEVLTTDYLYTLETADFHKFDKNPGITYVVYRQPLIDWIKSKKSSPQNPLNRYLDSKARKIGNVKDH